MNILKGFYFTWTKQDPRKKIKRHINCMFSIPDLKIRGSNSVFVMCCQGFIHLIKNGKLYNTQDRKDWYCFYSAKKGDFSFFFSNWWKYSRLLLYIKPKDPLNFHKIRNENMLLSN